MFTSLMFRKVRWHTVALVTLLPVGIVVLLCSGGEESAGVSAAASQEARQKAGKLLTTAHFQSAKVLDQRLQNVRALFARGRKGADAFAEDALSWSGKWALIKDTLGIGEDNPHAAFLSETFSKHIFTNEDLKAVLEGAIKGYVSDLDGIENHLLVQLRADLADSELGRSGKIPSLANEQAFRAEYRQLSKTIIGMLETDGKMEIGKQLAGFVAMDAATPIVLRIVQLVAAELGIEAGILSTGAASGVATLGIGLIVGIVADQIIAWLLKEAGYDPAAEIAAKVRASLDRVESLLIDGTKDKGGLQRELMRIGNSRSKCQDTVINRLLNEGGVK